MRSEIGHSGVQICSGRACNYPHISWKEVGRELGVKLGQDYIYGNIF